METMLRRQARLRREYLYRKSLEGKEKEEYEKKRKVKQALAEGKVSAPGHKEEYRSMLSPLLFAAYFRPIVC